MGKLERLRQNYLALTREQLPAKAKLDGWSLRHDHCFMRVVLDQLFQASWYTKLDRSKPAYKQLSEAQLEQAISLAERILEEGETTLGPLNKESLQWRGKG